MGLWLRHRQRQAGKYARRSYRLERRRLELELNRQAAALIVRVTAELPDVAAIPPRPDWKG